MKKEKKPHFPLSKNPLRHSFTFLPWVSKRFLCVPSTNASFYGPKFMGILIFAETCPFLTRCHWMTFPCIVKKQAWISHSESCVLKVWLYFSISQLKFYLESLCWRGVRSLTHSHFRILGEVELYQGCRAVMVDIELPVIIISYLWWHLRCPSPTGPSYHPTSSLMPRPCSHLVSTFASPVLLSGVWEFIYFCMPCWAERKCRSLQEPSSLYSHCSSEHHQQDAGPVCIQSPQIYLGLCSHISTRLDMDKDWVPFLFLRE